MSEKIFIVAEVGINHNGSVALAKQIIDAAKWAGADAVKFQKRTVEIVYEGELQKPRESPWGATLGAQKFGLELNRAQYDAIDHHCHAISMPWFASAWDVPSLEFLEQYALPYNKIASAMATHWPLVAAVAKQGKPTFVSTGMCTDQQVFQALGYFNGKPVTLLHCIGAYPAAEWMLNLRVIQTLKQKFGVPVGYSGHESSVSPSVMAAVLGATVIERHITIDRAAYGSDQAASLEPHGFKTMVEQIRKIPLVMGDGIRRVLDAEREVATKLRYWERKHVEDASAKAQSGGQAGKTSSTKVVDFQP